MQHWYTSGEMVLRTGKYMRGISPFAYCLCGAVVAIMLTSRHAAAADDSCQPSDGLSTCLTSDNLWPHGGGGRWLSQAPTASLEAGASFGFVNSYLHRPIGLVVASPDPAGTRVFAVEHALSATLLTAVGVNQHLHIDLALPLMLFQEGASKADVVGSDQALPRSAVGDLRFGSHVALLPDRPAGVGLAARFHMTVPTGQRDAFVSSPSATFAPGASADFRLGGFVLGIDVGARLRRYVQFAGAVVGNQLSTSLGASYDLLADDWLSINLEAFALFTLAEQLELVVEPGGAKAKEIPSSDPHIPAEWLLTVRTAHALDGKLSAHLGGGSFIPTGPSTVATTPALRLVAAVQYRYGD